MPQQAFCTLDYIFAIHSLLENSDIQSDVISFEFDFGGKAKVETSTTIDTSITFESIEIDFN